MADFWSCYCIALYCYSHFSFLNRLSVVLKINTSPWLLLPTSVARVYLSFLGVYKNTTQIPSESEFPTYFPYSLIFITRLLWLFAAPVWMLVKADSECRIIWISLFIVLPIGINLDPVAILPYPWPICPLSTQNSPFISSLSPNSFAELPLWIGDPCDLLNCSSS